MICAKTMDLDAQWAAGDLEPLKAALSARLAVGLHEGPQWLVESLCGGKFDPHHFTEYLKKKYTELYGTVSSQLRIKNHILDLLHIPHK